ncbi:MAG: plastocyanin/azurin family copper-binding protein [Silicimonas sp.]|nr:plastocyanin/azurin family copper-binding protein [Silicimonas sp.]
MQHTRRDHLVFLGAAAAATLTPAALSASDDPQVIEIQMLNKHPENSKERQVFYPDLVRAKVGDTIRFVATDKGHNSTCAAKGAPEGATLWKGKISKDVEVVLDTPGAYAFFCTPHRTAGMVGLLLVGDVSDNFEDIKGGRYRGKEKKRYEDIFARADAMLAEETS